MGRCIGGSLAAWQVLGGGGGVEKGKGRDRVGMDRSREGEGGGEAMKWEDGMGLGGRQVRELEVDGE